MAATPATPDLANAVSPLETNANAATPDLADAQAAPKRQKAAPKAIELSAVEQEALDNGLDLDTHEMVAELGVLLNTKNFSLSKARQQMRALLTQLEAINPKPRKMLTSADLDAHLSTILQANNDIDDAIDTISNVETIPDLEDIATIQLATKKIGVALDALFAFAPIVSARD
jgi:hypothetical protein